MNDDLRNLISLREALRSITSFTEQCSFEDDYIRDHFKDVNENLTAKLQSTQSMIEHREVV